MGNGLFVPSSTKVISCIAIDSENWICTKQRKSGGGNEGGTFTSFSVGLDESTNSFFEVTDNGRVFVGEHGIQQIPKSLNAIGTDIDSASIIPAGTSLVEVVLIDNNGGVKLPIASIGTEISLMKITTNLTDLYSFRIYPDNTTDAFINGKTEYLDVSATTKIVHCVAFDAINWICTKQHANGGGSEGGILESTTIGAETPAKSRFTTTTVEDELLVRSKAKYLLTGTKLMHFVLIF